MRMTAAVFASIAEANAWLTKIDRANGYRAPEAWARVQGTRDGRFAFAHPWGRVITPHGMPDPCTLTENDFAALE